MNTPICDFLTAYQRKGTTRLHMPGHKGVSFLGCEGLDLTEVAGADSLYEAEGIIAESEENATKLFGSRRTVYSTEGSSQCIRAMLYLALQNCRSGTPPVIVAARNVHKAFVYAAALLDFEVVWLWPEAKYQSLCGCPISSEGLQKVLSSLSAPPAAVYITSPDYLGATADIASLAEICHRYGTILAVDNAHGAYLHFLSPSRHPLDLGADICCDSAHKTLPVLTGGAYLHVAKNAPPQMEAGMKSAMALFGSTSPSYLTLASLDRCNRYLAEDYDLRLAQTIAAIDRTKACLKENGWDILPTDPLRITINAPAGCTGFALADRLRQNNMECEYADPDSLVLMLTPENSQHELFRLAEVMGQNTLPAACQRNLPLADGKRICSIRKALFAPHETIPVRDAPGRICGAPTVSCPPAIPIAVSGEQIEDAALRLFAYYGVETVDVLKESAIQ